MIKAKKSLGQNFLKDKRILDLIVQTSDVQSNDVVLEVGPGKGALTEKLLETGAKLIALELDHRLVPMLKVTFTEEIMSKQMHLVEADVLETNYKDLGLESGQFKIVANIPYYITGQFLRTSLETDVQPSLITLMIQKEVAERIVARDGKESLLSLSVKAYGEPKYIKTVPAKAFSPAPKIDSAVIRVDNINKDRFENGEVTEEDFFRYIKAGFSSKRKQLKKNLKSLADSEKTEKVLADMGLDLRIRAEDVSVGQWFEMIRKINLV